MKRMHIYLAGRYSRRRELAGYAEELRAMGHEVVSTWLDGHHEANSPHGANADAVADARERAIWACEDLIDLNTCNCLIAFTDAPDAAVRGGYNVELGWALGYNDGTSGWGMPWGVRVIVVGPRVNVFHCLDALRHAGSMRVEHYDDWQTCREALRQEGDGGDR